MKFLAGFASGLILMALLLVLPTHGSSYSLHLTHRIDVKVQRTQRCRPWIGKHPLRARRLYANRSSVYRRWALRVWKGRLGRCAVERHRVGVPPWFRSVMLCIHPKESSDWHLDSLYDGGLQFAPSTWRSAGGTRFAPYAFQASPNEQIRAAWDLTDGSVRAIRHHWPSTSRGCT